MERQIYLCPDPGPGPAIITFLLCLKFKFKIHFFAERVVVTSYYCVYSFYE